jgi:hypothetical protein
MFSKLSAHSLKSVPKFINSRFLSKTKEFYIERASPSDHQMILDLVMNHFVKEEPLTSALIPGQKPLQLEKMFMSSIEEGFSKVAKRCSNDEIVGVCINSLNTRETPNELEKLLEETEDPNLKKLFRTLMAIESEPKLYDLLCVDTTFCLEILSVNKDCAGKGLGIDLLRASALLGKQENYKFVRVNCVNETSKHLAEKMGMTLAWCCPYKTLLNRDGCPPRALPASPHHNAYVYYLDLTDFEMAEH